MSKNYKLILKYFFSYLPSRLLVVLNSFIIVPVFAQMLTSGEMGIFQLTIGVLNLVCTCTTDWISKSVLRFYQKYTEQNRLNEFLSNVVIISVVVYLITILFFILTSNYVYLRFEIPKGIYFFTLFMIIPVGLRQFNYQLLRIFDKPFLYTFCIVIYQISMLSLFLLFAGIIPKTYAILTAMFISISLIDVYIFKEIAPRFKFSWVVSQEIMLESLRYALPQIITNTSIWVVLNVSRFVFQYNKMFDDTAVISAAALLETSILTPLFSSFTFAIFPVVVRKFEQKNIVKLFITNSIQLYCALFIPLSVMFCYFSKDVAQIAFSGKYQSSYVIISFFAVTLLFHELMKLFNIKYHLKNKTYIEMAVSSLVGLLCLYLNITLIPKYSLVGAGISVLASMLLLFTLNIAIQFKDMDYVKYSSVLHTSVFSFLITVVAFGFVHLMFIPLSGVWIGLLKIVIYLFLCYLLSAVFYKKLLET